MPTCFYFGSPCYGHFNVTKNIVLELIRRGDRVVYFCEDPFRKEIEQLGAEYSSYNINYNQIETAITLQNISLSDVSRISEIIGVVFYCIEENILRYKSIIEKVKNNPPDYIIFDTFSICGKIVAKELSIPCATTVPIFVFNKTIAKGDDDLFTNYFLLMGDDPLFKRNKNKDMLHTFLERCDAIVKKKYGGYINDIFDAINCASDTNIVFTSKMIQPRADLVDNTYHFVGCSIPDEDQYFNRPYNKKHPQIYVSFGTTYVNDQIDFYEKCICIFRKHPEWRGILSIGNSISREQLTEVPQNCKVFSNVNQLKTLQESDLFITHGGANSANESLYYNVPMIICPVAGDQFIVGKQVEHLGCGQNIDLSITAQELEKKIIEILNEPKYKHYCNIVGSDLRSLGGYKKAVDIIMNNLSI